MLIFAVQATWSGYFNICVSWVNMCVCVCILNCMIKYMIYFLIFKASYYEVFAWIEYISLYPVFSQLECQKISASIMYAVS